MSGDQNAQRSAVGILLSMPARATIDYIYLKILKNSQST